MYKAKLFLDKDSLLSLYFSYIHSYINYAWVSTYKTNLKKIHSQQKQALRIMCNKDRYQRTKKLFSSCDILNVYKLNLLNTSIFMHKIQKQRALQLFILPLGCLLAHVRVSRAQVIAGWDQATQKQVPDIYRGWGGNGVYPADKLQ